MKSNNPKNHHFSVEKIAVGVYACIHEPGGAAYSNAGIIDLGGETLVVDASDNLLSGRELRQTAERLFGRPVQTLVLTHAHGDHWTGTSAFDTQTTVLSTGDVLKIVEEEVPEVEQMIRKPGYWEDMIRTAENQLRSEKDADVAIALRNQISRFRFGQQQMDDFKPRGVDKGFQGTLVIQGGQRRVELRAMGWGHSRGDAAVLLPVEKVAFIGDIGFFETQPFMGACHLEDYRRQVHFFLESDYSVLVPGHGPVGGKADMRLELEYFDVLEALVSEVVSKSGTLQEALQVRLPEIFHPWLAAGARRFEANVRYMYKFLQRKQASINKMA